VYAVRYAHANCLAKLGNLAYTENEGQIIKVLEVDRIYGAQDIFPLLQEADFVDIETYCDFFSMAPADPGRHFAFRCRKPEA